jgi:hypothetical protein
MELGIVLGVIGVLLVVRQFNKALNDLKEEE